MRTSPKTSFGAAAALALLAATSACAPGPGFCSPRPAHSDRFVSERGFTRENHAPVHPVMGVAAVAGTAACLLAGHRYN